MTKCEQIIIAGSRNAGGYHVMHQFIIVYQGLEMGISQF